MHTYVHMYVPYGKHLNHYRCYCGYVDRCLKMRYQGKTIYRLSEEKIQTHDN